MRLPTLPHFAIILLSLQTLTARGADKIITNTDYGVQIAIPESWTGDARKDHATPITAGGPVANYAVTVRVTIRALHPNTTLAAFADSEVKYYQKDFDILEQKPAILSEQKAVKVNMTWQKKFEKDTDADKQLYITYYTVSGTSGYSLRFDVLHRDRGDAEKYAKDIDAVVKSFKLLK
jgi:hypothetical protein